MNELDDLAAASHRVQPLGYGRPRPKKQPGSLVIAGIVLGIIALIVAGLYFSPSMSSPPRPLATGSDYKVYDSNVSLSAGNFTFSVGQALRGDHLKDAKPNASFLLVILTVRNNGVRQEMIPAFKLRDDQGLEYGTTSVGWRLGDVAFSAFEQLNPGVQKTGSVVFDVPAGRNYSLKVGNDGGIRLPPIEDP